jgi:selenium-binding protein 1
MTGLSNSRDHGGKTGMVEYTNDGAYVATHWMPTDEDLGGAKKTGTFADGYGYDARACRAGTCSSLPRSPAGTTT